MIGKVVPRPEFSSIARLNDYVLNRNGAGNDADKVMYSGALNILGGVKTATLEMESVADKNDRIKYPMDHYIFSWQEGEQPTAAQAKEAVQIALKELNVERCQCVYALHQNTDNCHLHIAVCRVDLQTYKAVDPAHGWTYKAVERAARLIEHRQGWNVERNAKHYVDDSGILHEILREKEQTIPQEALDRENLTGEKSAIRMAKERLKDVKPETWADLHEKLAALGMTYERKGSGAVIRVGDVPIKASDAGKRFSLKALEKKLGAYETPTNAPEKKHLAAEPLAANETNDDWKKYEAFRREYYRGTGIVYAALKQRIADDTAALGERQKKERFEAYGNHSWKGHGAERNMIRTQIAAKHAKERLDLKDAHDKLKAQAKAAYPKLPSYEEWLRQTDKTLDAEEWRHRADALLEVASFAPPIDFTGDAKTVKDLRGFESRQTKRGVAFVDPNTSATCFCDYGKKIGIYDHDPASALAAMQLGMQKWGSVSIKGSQEYISMCVELAARNGIKLSPKSLQQQVWAYQDRQMKQEREVKSPRVDGAREAFAKYHEAVGADCYRVTATQFLTNGGRRGFMMNRQDGAPDGFTPEQMIDKMSRLVFLEQTDNRNIYYTPISETKHHLVIDDLTPESLAEMISDGYQPCAVIETSPNNWQAIITIPKMGTDLDRQVANAVVADLNKKYGDPKFTGEIHPHRAPGFENRKPKHRTEQDTYPDVKLVKSRKVECPKTIELAHAHYERLSRQEAARTKRIGDVTARSSDVPTAKAYAAHFEDIYQSQRKKEAQTGKPTDLSRVDMMIATRLRATGHSQEDIASAIEVMSPRMREAVGKDPHAHNWKDYAERTATAAFGYKGDKKIEKYASYVRQWETIEGKTVPTIETSKPQDPAEQTSKTPTPKTLKTEQTQEAPAARPSTPQKTEAQKPKPLSADADKKRLEQLLKLRDDAGEAYADPIMEDAKQAKLAEIKAQRPAAEKSLADAEESLRDHEETEVELTFIERTFGGKSAQSKIAAHEAKTETLKKAVQKCKDAISVINAKERDPLGDSGRARRKQLEAKGRDDYDKAHPDEVREREMLEELYEKCRIGYVSNPISQPNGHKTDINRVARIMEIESKRGLTGQEIVAKHEGVRKVLEMVDKYRGREIDRGRGR